MRAAIIPAYKSNYRVENIPNIANEKLGAHELRVRTLFAGYSPMDWKIRNGFFQKLISIKNIKPSKHDTGVGTTSSQKMNSFMLLGCDFSGEVLEVGSSVIGFNQGDIVCGSKKYGRNHIGTFAEQIIVRDDEAVRVPEGMDPAFAGCVGLSGLTAFQCLEKAATGRDSLRGKSVVIIGASGGVGSFASLLAKHYYGAYVYGVCSYENTSYLNDLGVDEVIDYNQNTLIDYMKRKPKSERERIAAVLDFVGGDKYRSDSFSILGKGTSKKYITPVYPEHHDGVAWGKMITHSTTNLLKNTLSLVKGSCQVHSVNMHRDPKLLQELLNFLNQTSLWKKINLKQFPLENIQEADDLSETGKVRGKIALKIGEGPTNVMS